jgi:hypothetical protein
MRMLLLALLLSLFFVSQIKAQTRTDRQSDGLKGQVKSVQVERADISQVEGKAVESLKWLQSITNYDEKGNKTEELIYGHRGALLEKSVFTRDEKGTRTKIRYKADGTMISREVGRVDEQGRPLEDAYYDGTGALETKSVYTYDAQGNFQEAAMYNADGSLHNKTIFLHDATGKQTGLEVYDASGKLLQKQTETETERTVAMYGQGSSDTMQWKWAKQASLSPELDAQGNWIKKSTPSSITRGERTEEIVEVLYRTITYY